MLELNKSRKSLYMKEFNFRDFYINEIERDKIFIAFNIEQGRPHIRSPAPDDTAYTLGQKLLDLTALATAPGISQSNAIHKRIHRRLEYDAKKAERLKGLKLNGFDEHIFNASQQNQGVLTKEAIESYAKGGFSSDEARNTFLDYSKSRLGYLAYLGLLNDVSKSNKYLEQKSSFQDADGTKERAVKVKLDFKYEVNTSFYKYLLDYQKQKELELKEKFEFGKFDAYIYSFIQKNGGSIDLDGVKKERVREAVAKAAGIIHQARFMKELGYLDEAAPDVFTFAKGFKARLESGAIYLNAAEKKVVEFIERHGVFSLEKYTIDREVEAEDYAGILKGRLEKLMKIGLLQMSGGTYSFTPEGENRLKGFYAESYEFTSFDRNILNGGKDGIIDLEQVGEELEGRYGSESAAQTLERQKERLFIMECAGLVKLESAGMYSITGKGTAILEDENRIYTEEKRERLRQSFKYNDDDEAFFRLIKSRGGTIDPGGEIKAILDGIDGENGMYEFEAYNMVMRNYKCLGTAENVKLGYIIENPDGTLSLTLRGKMLVNGVNLKGAENRLKALANKKFRLLDDIDRSNNRLDPKKYLKTQRIIADKEQRKTVKLLRYQTERLYLLGLLDKNSDGSYSATTLFEEYSDKFRGVKKPPEAKELKEEKEPKQKKEANEPELKITKFDLDNIVNASLDGIFSKSTLDQSPKKLSIIKRMNTLVNAGLLIASDDGWRLSGELLDRAKVRENINLAHEKSHQKQRGIDCLTAEQKQILSDTKDFLNLTGSQILRYIYGGNEKLYRSDMAYLIRKEIIKKDKLYDIYVLTRQGSKLAAELTGDDAIFNSKINSRRQELKHDILIYTAFKDAEKKLKEQGKEVVSVKTDRRMKSEDMKKDGRMKSQYADLHVDFKDSKTGETGFINLEVDIKYSEKVIAQKLTIPNLRWYTNSSNQKEKVLKKARYMQVVIINENY